MLAVPFFSSDTATSLNSRLNRGGRGPFMTQTHDLVVGQPTGVGESRDT